MMCTASAARTALRVAPCQRGVGLLEMMVTITLGLFLVAATAGLFTSQLAEHRRVLIETRLTQELRAVLDLIARDVRRAGYWGHALQAAANPASAPANPYDGLFPAPATSDSRIGYAYSRDGSEDDAVAGNERFGLRQNTTNRSADWRMSGAALPPTDADTWQALTDPGVLRITRVTVSTSVAALDLLDRCAIGVCPAPAPGAPPDSASCPPRLLLRLVDIEVEGIATADPGLRRRLGARVTLRNPGVTGSCPAA
jgi:type IV pilus assembly protein PilW